MARGPITYNALYDGEDYDARMEKDGWDTPEYEPTAVLEHQRPGGWIMASIVEDPGGERISEIMPPIQICDVFDPVLIRTFDDGTKIYNVGKNIPLGRDPGEWRGRIKSIAVVCRSSG